MSNGVICEFDSKMNLVKTGDKIFSNFFGKFKIFARLFRQVIYSVKKIGKDNFVISSGNGFYCLNTNNLRLTKIKTPADFKKCLNVGVVDIEGDSHIIYSNYYANLNKNEISIYIAPVNRINDYKLVYTFKKNTINHIHSFYQNPLSKEIFFNVGDDCEQVGVWKLNIQSCKIEPIVIGSQDYRSVFCWFNENKYIYATDFPGGNNSLKSIDISKSGIDIETIASIKGPVIYGTETKNHIYFATSAEPVKNLGIMSFIPIFPIFQSSYLYQYEKVSSKLKCIASAKKDWLNPYLFGFGSYQFPYIENEAQLHVNRIGINKTISNISHQSYSSYDLYDI